MHPYPHLATRLYNAPLLLTPGKAEVIERVFRDHAEGRASALQPAAAPPRKELAAPGFIKSNAGYFRTSAGVALIPILGTLVQRAGSLDAASGMVGYNHVASMIRAAADDPLVNAILLEIDSNGGEAAGVADLASKIAAADRKKPTWAIANEAAFSAAYWIASASSRISVPESGSVGSIGVVMMHVDQSVKDAKAGITYTPIFAGARKVDFSSHAPLSDAAAQIAQSEVDRVYELFVDAVASGRKLDAQAVRATEAGIFHAKAALDRGLIDAVESFDATLAALSAEAMHYQMYGVRAPRNARQSPRGETSMSTEDNAAAAAEASAEQIAAAHARGFDEGKGESRKAGAEDERTRISAILTHAEAAGRRSLAEHLAFKTDVPIDQAAAMLAAAPKEEAAAPASLLARAMANVPNPKVGADGEASANATPQVISASALFAQRRRQAGHGE